MAKGRLVNGVDTDELFRTTNAIRKNPDIAKFKFSATNRWINGTYNRATVKDFYGALQEDTSREPVIFEIGEPPVLLGKNRGINPMEYLLIALSGCLTTSMVAHAAAKGIEIKGVESRYEGDLDLRGSLGISEQVQAGCQTIRVYFKIDANLTAAQTEELIQMAQKRSPVFNTITKSAPVSVHLDE